MLRLGLRRCAPIRRAHFAVPTVSQCQPRISQLAKPQRVTILPALHHAFHQSRILAQDATAAAAETVAPAATEPEKRMRFEDAEGVHPNLVRALTQAMGYEHMTDIQEETLRASLEGKDMVGQARTGTGKTIAFLLPMLQRMLDQDPTLADRSSARTARPDDIRGIVISPTRELAEQIAAEARSLARYTGLVVQSAVGGTRKNEMLRNIQARGCHLLVATPGRLNDLLSDPRANVAAPNLDALVLDEADRMLDVGFADALADIQSRLPDIREKTRQTMLFSATIPANVVQLAKAMVRQDQFEFVQTIRHDEAPTHERVPQNIAIVKSMINLFPTLYELMDREIAKAAENPESRPFKAIVYFGTTAMVETAVALDNALRRERGNELSKTQTLFIHGKLMQNQRSRAASNFKRAPSAVLFSSDVTARGMDFPDVTHVIQVGLPDSREQYIHRIGRTGRQDKEGEGWLLIPENDASEAANMMRGLGLKNEGTLESERIDIQSVDDMTPHIKQVTAAFAAMPFAALAPAYNAFFGNKSVREVQAAIGGLNKWATLGWGRDEPPSVRPEWLQRRGLTRVDGFRVDTGPRRHSSRDSSFERGGSFGGRGFSGGRGGGGDRPSFNNNESAGGSGDMGWDSFEKSVDRPYQQNDRRGGGSSRGFGGRSRGGDSRGFGGSRGGGRRGGGGSYERKEKSEWEY